MGETSFCEEEVAVLIILVSFTVEHCPHHFDGGRCPSIWDFERLRCTNFYKFFIRLLYVVLVENTLILSLNSQLAFLQDKYFSGLSY